jgi:hypothetical protein
VQPQWHWQHSTHPQGTQKQKRQGTGQRLLAPPAASQGRFAAHNEL